MAGNERQRPSKLEPGFTINILTCFISHIIEAVLTTMEDTEESSQRFVGYPKAVEGPFIAYKKSDDSNPVVRGTVLVIGAWL